MMVLGFERTVVQTDGWEPCTILHNVVKPHIGGYHKPQTFRIFRDGRGPGFHLRDFK